jgi:hypothetical protein
MPVLLLPTQGMLLAAAASVALSSYIRFHSSTASVPGTKQEV